MNVLFSFQAILDVVVNLQFSLIEKLWQTFWRYSPPDTVEGATVTENRWGQVNDIHAVCCVWRINIKIFNVRNLKKNKQKNRLIWGGFFCFVVFCFSFCSSISEIEARLPKSQLLVLCRNETVLKWMSTCDHLMYQALVEILIPDVLRPIPSEPQSHMTHALFVCLC